MDTPKQQNKIVRASSEEEEEEKKEGVLSPKQQNPTSVPPSASSPSHEFSFTLSLHPSTPKSLDKCKPTNSFAIDLSPADDIFFHGHLLPLQLISQPTVSPRNSMTSSDQKFNDTNISTSATTTINIDSISNTSGPKERSRPNSFSLFGLAKWRKGIEVGEKRDDVKKKKKTGFDMGRAFKWYMSLIQPLFSRGDKRKREFRRQPYSFSGNLNSKWKERGRRRGGEFSAPASMATSPTNSGLLLATATITSSSNDSSMEELQNAIQAAIAHCKNSIAVKDDKCKI